MAMTYGTTRSREKDHPPTPVVREQWGTSSPQYDADINNHTSAVMPDDTRILHPHTGNNMSYAEFREEIKRSRAEHGAWPVPHDAQAADQPGSEAATALLELIESTAPAEPRTVPPRPVPAVMGAC